MAAGTRRSNLHEATSRRHSLDRKVRPLGHKLSLSAKRN